MIVTPNVVYDGTFTLAWLRPGESVKSAGDGTGAAIIERPDGSQTRVDIGDTIRLPEAEPDEPFDPDWVVPPGATLQEWYDVAPSPLPLWERAARHGIEFEQLCRLLTGDEEVTGEIAEKLERLTTISAQMWLAMEENYRAGLAAGKRKVL